jgi:hypothetical protein
VAVNRLHSGSRSDRWPVAGDGPGAQPSSSRWRFESRGLFARFANGGTGTRSSPRARSFLKSMAWISLSEKSKSMVPMPTCPFNDADGFGDARRAHRAQGEEKAKNLERGFVGFYLSQAFEIPQNRQRNLWKSLEKTARDLEMFGKKAWRLAVARGNQLSRAERSHADRGRGRLLRRHEWKFLRSGSVRWP